MKVLLSIKPQFADEIFNGKKKFEFRRKIFKRNDVSKIVVYASAPISKVIGEFDIEYILSDTPKKIWNKTHKFSGISEEYFNEYFRDRDTAFAIKVKKFKRYCKPKALPFAPPQSFRYIESL